MVYYRALRLYIDKILNSSHIIKPNSISLPPKINDELINDQNRTRISVFFFILI